MLFLFISAGEFIVYIDGSECSSEADGLWVCQTDKHIQVAADAMLYAVLRWQVTFCCFVG